MIVGFDGLRLSLFDMTKCNTLCTTRPLAVPLNALRVYRFHPMFQCLFRCGAGTTTRAVGAENRDGQWWRADAPGASTWHFQFTHLHARLLQTRSQAGI